MRSPHPAVLTIGRSGVDLYPLATGVRLQDVPTFGRFLGGSPTNVAVAAARLGHDAAVVSGVGDDPFGRFVRAEMRRLGVDDRHVVTVPALKTPLTFCEVFPPDDFPLWFYREPSAPDLGITPDDVDPEAVRSAAILWLSVTGLSQEPSRAAHHAALDLRGRRPHTVLDLDYRPVFWAGPERAAAEIRAVLPHVTIAVGNREECRVAVGEEDPDAAADALLAAGVELAVVKLGPDGVLAKTRGERVVVPPTQVRTLNGLGAGDAFGGSLCHGLLEGWPLRRTLEFAGAAGAIVASRLECSTAMPTNDEVVRVLAAGSVEGGLAAAPDADEVSDRRTPALHRTLDVDDVTELRMSDPAALQRRLRERPRLPASEQGGRLLMIAADHAARGALRAGADRFAMADRRDLLRRAVIALSRPGVAGFVGTADVVEELAALGALDHKIVFGSMNRGGLAGAGFELDDRFTGYDARGVADSGLDGGKMLVRIDLDDPGSVRTLEAAGQAVNALADRGLRAMVEPFLSTRVGGEVRNDLSTDAVVRSVAIATGLGRTSAYTWLKLPAVDDMKRVFASSTVPMLILGGEVPADPDAAVTRWAEAMAFPTARGLVIGRSLLYPADGDVAGAVDEVAKLV